MFSIIIPTWNNLPYLKCCVQSIRQNSAWQHQIILHINEGNDGTIEWAQNEGIDFTQSNENIGICYAINQAFGKATADYIVYLNDDMYVLPQWDTALIENAQSMPNQLYMLSGTLIEPRNTGNACVIVADYGNSLENFRVDSLLKEYRNIQKPNWNGSSWPPILLHRNTWLLVGGFSTEFSPGMYSDPDLSMKLWHAGCRIFKGVGTSNVYHFQAKSTGRARKNDGRLQFKRKWGIAASYFYKNILKMGKPWKGALDNEKISPWHRLKTSATIFWKTLKS